MNKKSLVLLLMMLMASTSMVLGINTFSDDSQKEDIVLNETNVWKLNKIKLTVLNSNEIADREQRTVDVVVPIL